jgi:DNA-binding transcriptional regulator GbsR (MarR family)
MGKLIDLSSQEKRIDAHIELLRRVLDESYAKEKKRLNEELKELKEHINDLNNLMGYYVPPKFTLIKGGKD